MGQPYCVLLRLGESGYLVYSPGRELVDSARELMGGTPHLVIVAPAAGHTLGVKSWHEAFPDSVVVASGKAAARIRSKAAIEEVATPAAINESLPENISLLELPENRFGELWLKLESGDTVYWAVCDALMNLPSLDGGLIQRMLMKLYGLGVGLRLHKVFKMGVADKPVMRDWITTRISAEKHNVLIPCHGDIYDDPDLAERLLAIANDHFC